MRTKQSRININAIQVRRRVITLVKPTAPLEAVVESHQYSCSDQQPLVDLLVPTIYTRLEATAISCTVQVRINHGLDNKSFTPSQASLS